MRQSIFLHIEVDTIREWILKPYCMFEKLNFQCYGSSDSFPHPHIL